MQENMLALIQAEYSCLCFLLVMRFWALFAASARDWLFRIGNIRKKITGGFLMGAGVALALSRRSI